MEARIKLPPLATDDYERLKASIDRDGQKVPVLIDAATGEVVDGEHRLKACRELGLPPITEERELSPDEVVRLKVSLNLARRQLSPEQKRELALALRARGLTQQETAGLVGLTRSCRPQAPLF